MYPATLIPLLAIFATALPTTNNHAITIAKTMVARAPPEANAVLKSVTSAGTGCSGNSAQFIIKDNASMAFDSMIVESGEADLSKKCVVTIDLQLDPAWKYTINKATTIRGFVDHANATAKVLYTVAGQTVSLPLALYTEFLPRPFNTDL
ncbi:hypothetical protein BCR34DRAFT_575018 [Clohesyomyces aquaticus]|uniref:Uncharacterized protein n=1 Tax=Clohesyomyces aquaticus TaxID=1231657 RepID=A0A1Y1YTB7_9PLEO|nr:hypothetical protein BCR34DRAFT_575018 [Clohesyomyces aquaticus]